MQSASFAPASVMMSLWRRSRRIRGADTPLSDEQSVGFEPAVIPGTTTGTLSWTMRFCWGSEECCVPSHERSDGCMSAAAGATPIMKSPVASIPGCCAGSDKSDLSSASGGGRSSSMRSDCKSVGENVMGSLTMMGVVWSLRTTGRSAVIVVDGISSVMSAVQSVTPSSTTQECSSVVFLTGFPWASVWVGSSLNSSWSRLRERGRYMTNPI